MKGTGTIADVLDVGDYPIRLSLGDQVSVHFEPRNLGDWDGRHKVSNREFSNLKKGSVYEFQGMISYANYYFKQGPNGRFEFRVEIGGLAARLFRGVFGSSAPAAVSGFKRFTRFVACIAGILLGGVLGLVAGMIIVGMLVLVGALIGYENEGAAKALLAGIVVIAAIIGGVVGYFNDRL